VLAYVTKQDFCQLTGVSRMKALGMGPPCVTAPPSFRFIVKELQEGLSQPRGWLSQQLVILLGRGQRDSERRTNRARHDANLRVITLHEMRWDSIV
jgi:hypothetical protein